MSIIRCFEQLDKLRFVEITKPGLSLTMLSIILRQPLKYKLLEIPSAEGLYHIHIDVAAQLFLPGF